MKNKIIYIAGSGHSGSTLLDRVVGSSRNIVALGELEFLPNFVIKRKLPKNIKHVSENCLCTKPLDKCEFWATIIKKVDVNDLYNYRSTLWEKVKLAASVYLPCKPRFPKTQDEKLFNAIHEKSTAEFILDSSKDIRRLMFLDTLPSTEIRVIHLIRDGRGVVNSNIKLGNSGIGTYLRWVTVNILVGHYLRKKKHRYIRISYDQFATDPRKHLSKINKSMGLKVDPDNFIKEVNKQTYHHIDGNPRSREKLEKIHYDQSWKRQMGIFRRTFYNIITYIPNRRWVYHK